MQDRYAGDVGDFGKFSLLRYLFVKANTKLGVVWYLYPDELHNADGGHIDYLKKRNFIECDKELFEMSSTVVNSKRSVASLEKIGLLPSSTIYFSDRLDFHLKYPSQSDKDKEERQTKRKEWLSKAVERVSECNVVFLDPDNGLQISSCPKINQLKSGKFAYYSEITELAKDKVATVIYHHLNRHKKHGTHENQIRTSVTELRKSINPTGKIFALRFRPYSPRAYFILTTASEKNQIRESLLNYLRSSFGKFWDSFSEEKDL
jgi:hypothetical protein